MKFRLVDQQYREQVKWIWDYCFEPKDHPFYLWYFTNYYQDGNTMAGIEDDKLLCCLQLNPYQILLRDATLPCSYIVGLASMPEARRGGIIRQLLYASFAEMRRRGHYVSLLMPSKAGFYYSFDWEFCYHLYKYMLPIQDLQSVARPYGELSHISDKKKITLLDEVYQKFTATKHGYIVRTTKNWENMLESCWAERGRIYLLTNNGLPEGYVFFTLIDKTFNVQEIAYANQQAQWSIMQFIYNHRSQVDKMEWNAPIDDLLHFNLPDPKQSIYLYPFMMARIVDVVQVLAVIRFPPAVASTVVIQVIDELLEWNNGTFIITVNDGVSSVYRTDKQPEIVCRVGALTQLVFGRASAAQLVSLGKLTVYREEYLTILDQLFPVCCNFVNEYF